jgi:hypothetical protein
MAQVIEFQFMGSHGINEREHHYPWARWTNGRTWGFCPEAYGSTPKNFKKALREAERNLGLTVEIESHVVNDEHWVTFRFTE